MALPRNLFRKLRASISQYEATTGRRISPSVLRAFAEAEMSAFAVRSGEAGRLEESKRAAGVSEMQRERALEIQQKAAKQAGIAGTIEAGAIAAMAGKKLGVGKKLAPYTRPVTEPIKGAASAAIKKLGTAVGAGAVSPGGPGTIAYGGSVLYGAPEATGVAAPTVAGTAGAVAAPAAIGAVAGRLGAEIPIGKGETAGRIKGGIAGGVAVGAILPALGPVGVVIGVISGAIGGGKVICTELNRQGYIPDHILKLDAEYAKEIVDTDTFKGYWLWSKPYVSLMQNEVYGNIFTWLMKPFGVAWAYHMAHQIDVTITDSKLGYVLNRLGVPVCRWLGRKFGGDK